MIYLLLLIISRCFYLLNKSKSVTYKKINTLIYVFLIFNKKILANLYKKSLIQKCLCFSTISSISKSNFELMLTKS